MRTAALELARLRRPGHGEAIAEGGAPASSFSAKPSDGSPPRYRLWVAVTRNPDKLLERIREAIHLCLDAEEVPATQLELVGLQRNRVAG